MIYEKERQLQTVGSEANKPSKEVMKEENTMEENRMHIKRKDNYKQPELSPINLKRS